MLRAFEVDEFLQVEVQLLSGPTNSKARRSLKGASLPSRRPKEAKRYRSGESEKDRAWIGRGRPDREPKEA